MKEHVCYFLFCFLQISKCAVTTGLYFISLSRQTFLWMLSSSAYNLVRGANSFSRWNLAKKKKKMKFIKGCPAPVKYFALLSQVFVVGRLLQDARLKHRAHSQMLLLTVYIAPTTYWKLHTWQYPFWSFFNLSKAGDILQYVQQKQKKKETNKQTNTANANKQTSEGKPWLTSKRSIFVQLKHKIRPVQDYCRMPSITSRLRWWR